MLILGACFVVVALASAGLGIAGAAWWQRRTHVVEDGWIELVLYDAGGRNERSRVRIRGDIPPNPWRRQHGRAGTTNYRPFREIAANIWEYRAER